MTDREPRSANWWLGVGCLGLLCSSPLVCFVPVPMEQPVRPAGYIEVEDAGGERVPAAKVHLWRASFPHRAYDQEFVTWANSIGLAHYHASYEREWSFPLLMHGLRGYYWNLCVETDVGRRVVKWPEGGPFPILVTMDEATPGRCADVPEHDRGAKHPEPAVNPALEP